MRQCGKTLRTLLAPQAIVLHKLLTEPLEADGEEEEEEGEDEDEDAVRCRIQKTSQRSSRHTSRSHRRACMVWAEEDTGAGGGQAAQSPAEAPCLQAEPTEPPKTLGSLFLLPREAVP